MIPTPTRVSAVMQTQLEQLAVANDPLRQRNIRELMAGLRACEVDIRALPAQIMERAGYQLAPPRERRPLTAGVSLAPAFDIDRDIADVFGRMDVRLLGNGRFAARTDILNRIFAELPAIVARNLPELRTSEQRTAHAQVLRANAEAARADVVQRPSADQREVEERLSEYRRALHRLWISSDVAENCFNALRVRVGEMAPAAASLFLADEGSVMSWVTSLAPTARRKGVLAESRPAAVKGSVGFPHAAPKDGVRYR